MSVPVIEDVALWKDPDLRWELGLADHPAGEIALDLTDPSYGDAMLGIVERGATMEYTFMYSVSHLC